MTSFLEEIQNLSQAEKTPLEADYLAVVAEIRSSAAAGFYNANIRYLDIETKHVEEIVLRLQNEGFNVETDDEGILITWCLVE